MAQEKSTALTNAVAEPRLASRNKGLLRNISDTMEVADGANGDSAILKVAVPVDAQIKSIIVASDDLVGDATISVGFYRQDNAPIGTTFTEVDKDIIANDLDANDAALAPTEVRFSALGIETRNQKAWQLASLSSKPSYGELFVALTFETDTEVAGTVMLDVTYVL